MSTVAYGALTRKREEAAPDTSAKTEPPGVKSYVDVLSALVPGEVLAVFALLLPVFTQTQIAAEGANPSSVTVTDLNALRLAFWLLVLASMALYLLGRMKGLERWDFARVLIPPLAFVGWVMLQHPIVFDAVGAPSWSTGVRTVVAVVGALVLSGVASALAYKADANSSKSQIKQEDIAVPESGALE